MTTDLERVLTISELENELYLLAYPGEQIELHRDAIYAHDAALHSLLREALKHWKESILSEMMTRQTSTLVGNKHLDRIAKITAALESSDNRQTEGPK